MFRSIARSYYKGAAGAILVFDLSRAHTFKNIKKWMKEVKEEANSTISFILVGNKCDLDESKIAVNREEVKDFSSENDIEYIETSAKEAKNIDKVFKKIAEQIYKKIEDKSIDPSVQEQGVKVGGLSEKSTLTGTTGTKRDNNNCTCSII